MRVRSGRIEGHAERPIKTIRENRSAFGFAVFHSVQHFDFACAAIGEKNVAIRSRAQFAGLIEARGKKRDLESGQHLKRGLLLHGPPGTGKTLTTRYLIGRLTDHTVVLLSGAAFQYIEAAATLARSLQPALVILEDVALVEVAGMPCVSVATGVEHARTIAERTVIRARP